jgi:hypothetical protein
VDWSQSPIAGKIFELSLKRARGTCKGDQIGPQKYAEVVVRPWVDPHEQTDRVIENAIAKLETLGSVIVDPVGFTTQEIVTTRNGTHGMSWRISCNAR